MGKHFLPVSPPRGAAGFLPSSRSNWKRVIAKPVSLKGAIRGQAAGQARVRPVGTEREWGAALQPLPSLLVAGGL